MYRYYFCTNCTNTQCLLPALKNEGRFASWVILIGCAKTDGPIIGNITGSFCIFLLANTPWPSYRRIARSISNKNCEILWERVPYLSALGVCSRQDTIQIYVYLHLYPTMPWSPCYIWRRLKNRLRATTRLLPDDVHKRITGTQFTRFTPSEFNTQHVNANHPSREKMPEHILFGAQP